MYILGDIGNTETKICLVNLNNKIIKKIKFPTSKINLKILDKIFKKLIPNIDDIKKILFCSVVPKSFLLIQKYFLKKQILNVTK